jgi:Zn-dependent peptidase ImmA (M78 family)
MLDDTTIGERLQGARRAIGLTQGEVGKQMRLAISTVSEIEAGKRPVAGTELHAFARIYHRPVAYFLEAESDESPGFAYLFRAADSQLLDRRAIVEVQELARDYDRLEEIIGSAPLPLPPDYSGFGFRTEQDAENLAEMERGRIGLGDTPIKDIDLVNLLDETVGVRCFLVPVDRQSWSAVSVRDFRGRPCIAVNSLEESYRRSFDLAHDYAHVLVHLGRTGGPEGHIDHIIEAHSRPADERFADSFAAAFLMPRRAVLAHLERVLGANSGRFTDFDLVHLAMHFGVSGPAMSLRLVGLRKLGRPEHVEYGKQSRFKNLAAALGYQVEGWTSNLILPRRYRYLAIKAYADEQISLAKLAEYLREPLFKLREQLQRLSEDTPVSAIVERLDAPR